MALPAEARRRWNLVDGGTVDVADLGTVIIIVPADHGGLRSVLGAAIGDAGGYGVLAERVASADPELS